MSPLRLAWLQLGHEKLRMAVAVAGVAFAVVLVFVQLGFQDALFRSATVIHRRLDADVFLISPQSAYLATMRTFSRRRLYQVLGMAGVESVTPVYAQLAPWKNPDTGESRAIFIVGFDPSADALLLPAVDAKRTRIRLPDMVLFDAASRPEFGPIVAEVRAGRSPSAEVLGHRVTVDGVFHLGVSFGIDGTIVTSDENFLRIHPTRPPGLINLGLVKLRPGVDPEAMRDAFRARLPSDVEVLTRADYLEREKRFWATNTPIGYAFTFGVVMGWFVGAIIVYQILFADVSAHLGGYATLKAMGYRHGYLYSVVLVEAVLLAVGGFLPGIGLCAWLYRVIGSATHLPMTMTPARVGAVLGLTVAMCGASGLLAMRKVRSADPAEIF